MRKPTHRCSLFRRACWKVENWLPDARRALQGLSTSRSVLTTTTLPSPSSARTSNGSLCTASEAQDALIECLCLPVIASRRARARRPTPQRRPRRTPPRAEQSDSTSLLRTTSYSTFLCVEFESAVALLCAGDENRRPDRCGGSGVLADVTADVLSSERWRAELWTFAPITTREGIVSTSSPSAIRQKFELSASQLMPPARNPAIEPGEVSSRGVYMHILHIQALPTWRGRYHRIALGATWQSSALR